MEQRLLRNAYLFEDPSSYQAGVRDTFAMFERTLEQDPGDTRAEADGLSTER